MAHDEFFRDFKIGDILTNKGHYEIDPSTDRKMMIDKLKKEGAQVYSLKLYFHQTGSVQDDVERVDNRVRFLQELDVPPYLTIYHYPHHKTIDFEVHAPGTNKEKPVVFLSNYYGIDRKNVITFGDQINDLPVACGSSFFVAVKNGIDLVKYGSQKLSAFSNDEDAVVKEAELFLSKQGIS